MKIRKKTILFTTLFIVFFFIAYFIVSTFNSSTLVFKSYFYSQGQENNTQYHYKYRLNQNNQIIYCYQKENKIFINKILDNTVASQNIVNFDFDYGSNFSFTCLKDKIFIHSGLQQMLYIIDSTNKQVSFYDHELVKEKLVLNDYTQDTYFLKENELYKLEEETFHKMFDLNVKNIKSANFISEKELIITNYDHHVYSYDLMNNTIQELDFLCTDYIISKQRFIGVYKAHNQLKISTYSNHNLQSFSIKDYNYRYVQACDNYLYLIAENQIAKINFKNQKLIEKCDIDNYVNMEFSLSELLIIDENLMYLPMIKTTIEYDEKKEIILYTSYLYRYAK